MFVLVPYAAVQKKGLEPSRCFELAGEDGAEIVGSYLQQCVMERWNVTGALLQVFQHLGQQRFAVTTLCW